MKKALHNSRNAIFPSDLRGNDRHPVEPIRGWWKIVPFFSSHYPTVKENELYLRTLQAT